MAALPTGHGLVEAPAREHEAATCWESGGVAREADQRVGEFQRLPDRGVVRVEARLSDMRVGQILAPGAPVRVGHHAGDVGGSPKTLPTSRMALRGR